MTTSPVTSAAFQRALDDCMARVLAGADLETALASYPEDYRGALSDMVRAAQRLQALPSDPDPAFERLLEGRVRTAMQARAAAPAPSPMQAWWGQTWGALRGPLLRPVALAGVAAALITGGGVATVQASENSLPDSPLYVVKTMTEQVALAVAPSEPARQTVLLNQVTQRTDDLLRAAATNKSEKVLDTAADRLEQRISAAVDYALKAEARGDTAPAAAAEQLLDSLEARLDALPPRESVQKAKQAVAEQKDKLKNPPKAPAKPTPTKPAGSPTPRPAATPRATQPTGGRTTTDPAATGAGVAVVPAVPTRPDKDDDDGKPAGVTAGGAQGGGEPKTGGNSKPATETKPGTATKPAQKQPTPKPTQTTAAKPKEQQQTVKPEQPAFVPPTPVKDPAAKPPAAKPSATAEKKRPDAEPPKPSPTPKPAAPKPAATPAAAPRKTEGAEAVHPAPPPAAPAAAQPPAASPTPKPAAPAPTAPAAAPPNPAPKGR